MTPINGNVLLTGATGYVGSHTWVELTAAGYRVIGVDNFSNSVKSTLEGIAKIIGHIPVFIEGDVRDEPFLKSVINQHNITAVIHFAAFKSVRESVENPIKYYQNNLNGLFSLLNVLGESSVRNFIFSSSATVYASANPIPYTESMELGATNPYGFTKIIGEKVLMDMAVSDPKWKVACLRYFNPAGCHTSGYIGEDPKHQPNNLVPILAQVASKEREKLFIYGGDWPTHDGTPIRDYVHVMDIARGHIRALEYIVNCDSFIANLGTGVGTSVLELVRVFERSNGVEVPYEIVGRRPGDLAAFYADTRLASILLDWRAKFSLEEMCKDAYRWKINSLLG